MQKQYINSLSLFSFATLIPLILDDSIFTLLLILKSSRLCLEDTGKQQTYREFINMIQ